MTIEEYIMIRRCFHRTVNIVGRQEADYWPNLAMSWVTRLTGAIGVSINCGDTDAL